MRNSVLKLVLFSISLWVNSTCLAQAWRNDDTIIVIADKFFDIEEFDTYGTLLISKDTLYYNGRKKGNIFKSNYFLNLTSDSLFNSARYDNSYYIFVTKKGQLIGEGYFMGEHFDGIYKEYYKNGNLKKMGTINDGAKVGKWLYYERNNKLLKTEIYRDDSLIKSF
ncbi:MAG: hypothetical protein CFE21_00740 [Bacteroidetes bacterium B1(2017)]|nr:MAG: hypothetical protein CFE21_00740 [Bacteroidetes bacterium B1(2017)]